MGLSPLAPPVNQIHDKRAIVPQSSVTLLEEFGQARGQIDMFMALGRRRRNTQLSYIQEFSSVGDYASSLRLIIFELLL